MTQPITNIVEDANFLIVVTGDVEAAYTVRGLASVAATYRALTMGGDAHSQSLDAKQATAKIYDSDEWGGKAPYFQFHEQYEDGSFSAQRITG